MSPKRASVAEMANDIAKEMKSEIHTSVLDKEYGNWELLQVPIEAILPNPDQPRKEFNEVSIRELAQSIESKGLMEPLVVRPHSDGKFELIAGERRLRALKILQRAKAPVIVRDTKDPLELALIENIQREDLSPIDLAEAIQNLKIMHGATDEAIANVLGKSRQWVSDTLVINNLNQEIKNKAKAVNMSRAALIEIARDPAKAPQVFDKNNKAPTQKQIRDLRKDRIEQRKPQCRMEYQSPKKGFRIQIVFDKAIATRADVKSALQEALVEMPKAVKN